MKLSEIEAGIAVRCPCCGCGDNKLGYTEGEIFFDNVADCGCRTAYHKHSNTCLAFEFCPKCGWVKSRQWIWAWHGRFGPSKIQVMKGIGHGARNNVGVGGVNTSPPKIQYENRKENKMGNDEPVHICPTTA